MDDLIERRYLLMKRDLYYAPDNKGYTGIKDKAGRYLESDASPRNGVTAIHEDEAPDFSPACWDDLKVAHLQDRIAALEADKARLMALLQLAISALTEAREALHFHYVEWDGEPEDAVPLQLARAKCDQAISVLKENPNAG